MAERVPPTIGVLEATDGGCLLYTGAQSLDMLAVHLALIGVEFEVREPAELVDHIRRVADRLMRATVSREEEHQSILA